MPSHVILPEFFSRHFVRDQLSAMQGDTKMGAGGILGTNEVNSDTRRSSVGWPNARHEIIELAKQAATKENERHWQFNLDGDGEYQLTHYSSHNAGVYHTHVDMSFDSGKPKNRKLSFVVQLSDGGDYFGGDLALNYVASPDHRQARGIGTLIVFPSFVPHSVGPLVRGERWSLVSWLSGPQFR